MIEATDVRAMFVGGLADGKALNVPTLAREIVVAVGEDGVQIKAPDAEGDGYRLVEPIGPEMPVYVAVSA